MSKAILDLRINAKLTLLIDKGISYQPSISGLNVLDSEYTLEFENKIYTVSNGGLILEEKSKSIIINISENDFEQGNHRGILTSNSKQAGIYLKIIIEISCDGGGY